MEEKNCENQELEIDLIELCRELKNHIALIIAATVIFAAAAGAYIHFMTVPKYAYTRMIKLPANAPREKIPNDSWDQDKLTYVNILKLDISNPALWKENSKGHLADVKLVEEKNIKANLITFQFEGTDPVYLKKESDAYLDTAVQKLNVFIGERKDANFNDLYLNTMIRDELKEIRLALAQSSVSSDSVLHAFTDLEKRLSTLEKNESFLPKQLTTPDLRPLKYQTNHC